MIHQDSGARSVETAGNRGAPGGVPLIDVLKAALSAHQRGDLEAAESGYRAVLDAQPGNPDALQYLGVIAHARGDSDTAIRLLRKALKAAPRNGTIHNNLASIYVRNGRHDLAERHYRKALECPDAPEDALCNLGVLERMQGRIGASRRTLAAAVERYPNYVKARRELAETLVLEHDFSRAEPLLRAYIDATPDDAPARARYGLVLQRLGRLEEAQDYFFADGKGGAVAEARDIVRALAASEPSPEAWARLDDFLDAHSAETASQIGIGGALVRMGHVAVGLKVLEGVANRHPGNVEVWNDIGSSLAEMGRGAEGLQFLQHATRIDSGNADIWNNLGNIQCELGQVEAAIPALQRAIALRPNYLEAHVALCRAYRDKGELDKSVLYARAAMALPAYTPRHFPTLAQTFRATCDFDALDALGSIWDNCALLTLGQLHSVFLSLLVHTHTEEDARRFMELIRAWAEPIEKLAAASPLPPFPANRRPGRLRIGILSSDLRAHSVARFFMPVARGYDRQRFELYCYTPAKVTGDAVQVQIRKYATRFTFLEGKTDREIAEIIRGDEIDILIDLNGFTQGSCIKALVYRPAPVQMTWMGYPFTLNLDAVDYFVLDRFTKPVNEDLLNEEIVVMPDAWLCFRNFAEVRITEELPLERNGYVTFGTLNNPYKITREVVALWARVMREVPDSRFLLVRPEVKSAALVHNLVSEFARNGIPAERLAMVDNRAHKRGHLSWYNDIDITLETYPVTGGTTTCEALWMGVPAVSLVGPLLHQRISYAILMHCGLDELCAEDAETFVARAVALSRDPARLRAWRTGLRDVMRASPLCDEPRFLHQFQEMLEQVAQIHGLR